MHIKQVIEITKAKVLSEGEDYRVSKLSYDTRKLIGTQEELFFAIPGEKRDGHTYLKEAHQKGVRNFLVSNPTDYELADSNILLVADVVSAMQAICTYHRQQYHVPVVGITGSNGKTIVKEWLSHILEKQFSIVKSPKSHNSQIGVPLSVWALDDHHDVGIFEAGISQPGEMDRLESVIRPTVGIFTNIGDAHGENFSGQQEKIEEKSKLFKSCEKVFCRIDHQAIHGHLEKIYKNKVVTWAIDKPEATYNFSYNVEELKVSLQDRSFKIKRLKKKNLENLLHAISVAMYLGLSDEHIQAGIDDIKPVKMRLEVKRGEQDCYIIDDSYSNDLQGLSVALEFLKEQPHKKDITVILSDIQQSGLPAQILYEKVSDLLSKSQVSRLIGVGKEILAQQSLFPMSAQFFEHVDQLIHELPDFSNELILVKGARTYVLERIVALLEEKYHGTLLEINLESVVHNLNLYRNRLNPDVKVMAMVKAFAYGSGTIEIASLLAYHNVDYLGVAYLDEALELRKKGVRLPIMIMNTDWDSLGLLSAFDLEPEIYSLEMLTALIETSLPLPVVHLKLETGMNRLGFIREDLSELMIKLNQHNIKVASIFTHFSSAEDDSENQFTLTQATLFDQMYAEIAAGIGYTPLKHALNSAGIAKWPKLQYDMVRLGIGLYGHDSSGSLKGLRHIGVLKARISQLKKVKKGETIGYSRKGKALKDSLIATVTIGYADGYGRQYGNGKAYVMINGQKAKTIGNVCMDMVMVDVTDINAEVGDEVIIFGEDPNIKQLADWSDTIPYEILTNVSQRVKRIFVSE